MKKFFVKVDLIGSPTTDCYNNLQEIMAKNGFATVIQGYDPSGKQTPLPLPHCLYFGSQISEVPNIRDSLFEQLERIWENPVVLVIESSHWAFRD